MPDAFPHVNAELVRTCHVSVVQHVSAAARGYRLWRLRSCLDFDFAVAPNDIVESWHIAEECSVLALNVAKQQPIVMFSVQHRNSNQRCLLLFDRKIEEVLQVRKTCLIQRAHQPDQILSIAGTATEDAENV